MAPPPSQPIDRVLLVEGQDDKHIVLQLCERHQSTRSFFIDDKGNIDQVLESIALEIKAPDRQAVGILVDANDDRTRRWAAVQNRLRRAGITSPQSPDPDGTIIQANPRIGIWLMPDNTSAGELEDFVAKMIPDNDPVWPLSQSYIDGIPSRDRKFIAKKRSRAQVYAWLATRKDPRQMGTAIKARDLEVDGALSQKFVAWLNNLFG